MATITQRRRKDGSIAYRALVRLKEGGRVVYSESRTFSKLAVARRWAGGLEAELQDPAARKSRTVRGVTVKTLIERYIEEVDPVKPLGRTKRYVLELLMGQPIAEVAIEALGSEHVIAHCKARQKAGAGPATLHQDVIYLRLVLAMAKPAWALPVTAAAVDEAMPVLKQLSLVANSRVRDRRPTPAELEKILAELARTDELGFIPMVDIVKFALATTRRQGEIVRVLWEDLDEKKKTLVVRDMKDPRVKKGNDFEFPLLGEAFEVVMRQPRIDARIFPYDGDSVASRWERVRDRVKVVDLTFHDLRTEAISRLFEAGYQIHEVAQVSGHKDLNTLWRIYTKLKAEAVHRPARLRRPR